MRVQEYVHGRHPEADGVLPVVIYSDETHVSRSRNVHVLLVFIALPMHIMRADGGLFRYLAFPPSFKGRDIGLSKSEGKRSVFTPGGTLNSAVNPTQWHLYKRLSCVSIDARAPPH